MAFYIEMYKMYVTPRVWEITATAAKKYAYGEETYTVGSGEDGLQILQTKYPESQFEKLNHDPGEYFPRMTRPSSEQPNNNPGHNPGYSPPDNLVETGLGQLAALREQLDRICRVVQPTQKNFQVFGHEIRNLIILACTEVESHWKGVLRAHNARAENTHDYVKLAGAMRLGDFAVAFAYFPWLPPIKPFHGWAPSGSPTKDLKWYHAYNSVKHDRDTHFEKATLEHALNAVCGCAIMMVAQFGWDALKVRSDLVPYLYLKEPPRWPLSEVYSQPNNSGGGAIWTPKRYQF
jgi:hypothetical protein